jgi:hypothetical protein
MTKPKVKLTPSDWVEIAHAVSARYRTLAKYNRHSAGRILIRSQLKAISKKIGSDGMKAADRGVTSQVKLEEPKA